MKTLVFFSAIVGVLSAPQAPSNRGTVGCPLGLIGNEEGNCVSPSEIRNNKAFSYPEPKAPVIPEPPVASKKGTSQEPPPTSKKEVVQSVPKQPVMAPVLKKSSNAKVQDKSKSPHASNVIEVPSNPNRPEVFFVNYDPGENTELPGGIDLQQALTDSERKKP